MKKVIQGVGVLALLCSSAGFAATVTVTSSIANDVPVGSAPPAFFVTVGSADMPTTTGATLNVSFNAAVISIGTATPIAPNFNFAVYTPTGVGTGLVSVISTSALGIAGPFSAFTLGLTALAGGNANLQLFEAGADFGWSDVQAVNYPDVVYQNANITVASTVVPLPATAWLLATAVGVVGMRIKRRRS